MQGWSGWFVAYWLVAAALLSGCSPGANSNDPTSSAGSTVTPGPESITVAATNPYYLMQVTYQGTQVQSGTKIAGCTIASYSKCPGAELSGRSLQGAFLSYSAFPKADLTGVNLKVGSIAFADFTDVTGRGLDLAGTSLVRTDLSGSNLRGARMVLNDAAEVDLSEAVLDDATVVDTSFVKADLRGATLKGAVVRGDVFSGADIRGVDFAGADLSESNLVGARASGATWRGATFCNTLMPDGSVKGGQDGPCPGAPEFGPAGSTITLTPSEPFYLGAQSLLTSAPAQPYGATLAGCELVQQAKCPDVDFSGMDLTGVLLAQSDLHRANLDDAKAENASLVLSNLAGATAQRTSFVSGAVTGSGLRGAQLADTQWTFASAALADMRESDLSGADFGFGDLVGADLTGANLVGVDLSDSNAIGVNLTDATLRGVNLANADLTGATLTGADLTDAQYCNTVMPNGSVKAPQEGLCPGQQEPTATPSP